MNTPTYTYYNHEIMLELFRDNYDASYFVRAYVNGGYVASGLGDTKQEAVEEAAFLAEYEIGRTFDGLAIRYKDAPTLAA